jgi:hypothetical protein
MVHDWLESALIGSYIGGLKDEIRTEVKLFQPTSLPLTISLARLQEDKLQKMRRSLARLPLLPTPSAKPPFIPTNSTRVPLGTNFKRLTWNEMQAHREKGLCYNCNEKFASGHRCKTQEVFLLEVLTEDVKDDLQYEETARDEATVPPKILLHRVSTPQTM